MTDELERFRQVVSNRIGEAKTGDRASALWLMKRYCESVEQGRTYVRELFQYFSVAFRDILEWEDEGTLDANTIVEALNLKRPSHRPRTQSTREERNRDMLIAALVLKSHREPKSEVQAISNVAQNISAWTTPWLTKGRHKGGRSHQHQSKVRNCWDEYGDEVKAMPLEDFEEILSWESAPTAPRAEFFADLHLRESIEQTLQGNPDSDEIMRELRERGIL